MIAKMKARGFHCSFCGKARGEVSSIVAGAPQATPGVPRQMIGKSAFICNECVRLYHEIITASELPTRTTVIPK
jgi:ATP-dependent protease Clp ATPase subunit